MSEHNYAKCADTSCWCHQFSKTDMVNHPNHYMLTLDSGVSVEALEIIKFALTEKEFKGYLKGNCIKYLLRHNYKNGEEDIAKMVFYTKEL